MFEYEPYLQRHVQRLKQYNKPVSVDLFYDWQHHQQRQSLSYMCLPFIFLTLVLATVKANHDDQFIYMVGLGLMTTYLLWMVFKDWQLQSRIQQYLKDIRVTLKLPLEESMSSLNLHQWFFLLFSASEREGQNTPTPFDDHFLNAPIKQAVRHYFQKNQKTITRDTLQSFKWGRFRSFKSILICTHLIGICLILTSFLIAPYLPSSSPLHFGIWMALFCLGLFFPLGTWLHYAISYYEWTQEKPWMAQALQINLNTLNDWQHELGLLHLDQQLFFWSTHYSQMLWAHRQRHTLNVVKPTQPNTPSSSRDSYYA